MSVTRVEPSMEWRGAVFVRMRPYIALVAAKKTSVVVVCVFL